MHTLQHVLQREWKLADLINEHFHGGVSGLLERLISNST
jgi:hypothetical protein